MTRWIASTAAALALAAAATLGCGSAAAQTVDTGDPLHAFCYGSSACSDTGTVTPITTGNNPPSFGFSISPGPQTGDYLIDVLVPNNDAAPASYSITGTQGGVHNNQTIAGTATEVSSTAWTSGNLGNYLHLGPSASPTNPLSNWLGYTQANDDPGATGYLVFQANLGLNQLMPNSNELSGPLLTLGSPLPNGTVITGFLDTGPFWSPNWVATASSGGLYIDRVHRVPEPGSVALLAIGLLGVGLSAWRRGRKVRI